MKKKCVICKEFYSPGITPEGEIKTKGNWEKSITCSLKCKAVYCAQGNARRAEEERIKKADMKARFNRYWPKFVFGK